MNYFNGKTVLVTGATGFIGTHLVNRLRKSKNINIVLISRKQAIDNIDNITWIKSPLDQLSTGIWDKADIQHIDLVFHLGAFTPKSITDINQVNNIYSHNLLGTRSLLESLPNTPERFIFASTIDVYAQPSKNTLLDENSPLTPSGLYGASKLFCEQLIHIYAKIHGVSYTTLRYGHIFGPGEAAYAKLIPQMIRSLLRGEPPILFGNGNAKRDFLYVDDAVEATIRAATSNKTGISPINIVRGSSSSLRDIAKLLIKITGFKNKIKYQKDKPKGHSFRFNNNLMRKTLGEWEFVSLEDGLRHEVECFRSMDK